MDCSDCMKKEKKRKGRTSPPKTELDITKWALFHFFIAFCVLFLPLFFLTAAMDETLMPRMTALSFFLLFLTLLFFNKSIYSRLDFSVIRRSPIFLFMAAYLVITVFSLLFALNPVEGFFDINRTLISLCMTILAVLIFGQIDNWMDWLPGYVFIAAAAAFVIGAMQYFGHGGDLMRVIGVMSNKNEYAMALLLMLPFICFGLYRYTSWEGKVAAGVTLVLALGMIVVVETRSAYLAIGVAAFVICLLLLFFPSRFGISKKVRRGIAGFLIVGTIGLVVLFNAERVEGGGSFYDALRSITDLEHHSINIRIRGYSASLSMIRERPLSGFGAGNWKINVPEYFEGRFVSWDELNWRRPHNDFLWVFAEKGVAGMLFYLGILALTGYYIVYSIFCSSERHERVFALCLLGGFICYHVVAFFNFPYERMNHQVYLAIITAGAVLGRFRSDSVKTCVAPKRAMVLVPAVILFGIASIYSVSATMMEIHIQKARSSRNAGDLQSVRKHAQNAAGYKHFRNLDPLSNPVEYYMGQAYQAEGDRVRAKEKYEKALSRFPSHANTLWALAVVNHELGNLEEAAELFEHVVDIYPGRRAHTSLSAIYHEMGDYKNSMLALKRIEDYEDDDELMHNISVLEDRIEDGEAGEEDEAEGG